MNDDLDRLKHDVNTIQAALGLDVWTRRDVRRGFLGVLAGAAGSFLFAIWALAGGSLELGLLSYLSVLLAIVVAKSIGYGASAVPSTGTRREVSFYSRYYHTGAALISGYFFWGQYQQMDTLVLLASTVIMTGMWYLFYGLSAASRSLAFAGAVPLIGAGFLLAQVDTLPQFFGWLGLAAGVGCSFEAALLFLALRQIPGSKNPPACAQPPSGGSPHGPLVTHAAH